ncbi:hypothetical protein Cfor_06158 [Coptotermes formosanus]|uniref:Peroxisomal leader peptide-processing protease n=1 Tax=Coptotermes formosanus TaxID=36987 RepID=A0A6L2PZ21_COPFO|nr:hypothetical protein Cfor_06158 [Coptotermes formosanus]
MVACSLSWWRGEWVGFTMGVSLAPVVRRMFLTDTNVASNPSFIPPATLPDQLAGVDDSVVLVRCGVHWGSGVVVDSRDGIILTCSHVVSNAQNYGVKIYWNGRQYIASVLFRSRDGCAYDAAVLRTGPGAAFRSVNFSSITAIKGNIMPEMNNFSVLTSFLQEMQLENSAISFFEPPYAMMSRACSSNYSVVDIVSKGSLLFINKLSSTRFGMSRGSCKHLLPALIVLIRSAIRILQIPSFEMTLYTV